MQIGLDLRFLSEDLYSQSIIKLVQEILKKNPDNKYNLYLNSYHNELDAVNASLKKVSIPLGSMKEQTHFFKILQNEKNGVMVFFNHNKPIRYRGEYVTIIPSLKDIYYQDFGNYIEKYKYMFLLEKNLQNSDKLICFDDNTKDELIERLNIREDKIHTITPFFINTINNLETIKEELKIDIQTKYNLKNSYLIYAGGNGIEKNTERLIHVYSRLKKQDIHLDLVVLGDDISKNIELRNLVIEHKLQENIHFLGKLKDVEKVILYKKSLGVIFPSLYEPFPFYLSDPLYLNTNILTSNLNNIQKIMGKNAYYFSPISTNSILETIKLFLEDEVKIQNHTDIIHNYSAGNTAKKLLEIII